MALFSRNWFGLKLTDEKPAVEQKPIQKDHNVVAFKISESIPADSARAVALAAYRKAVEDHNILTGA